MRFAIRGTVSVFVLAFAAAPLAVAGGIPAKTLKELKAASVYVKVQFTVPLGKPISITGSGFVLHVDGDTALIATNQHVVSPLPGLVLVGNPKLVFLSGTPKEKIVEAQVVASDPSRDLAILKVSGIKDLPRPIPLDNSIEVVETMTVWVFGFPFGEGLALGKTNPAITINKGTVSSLRHDDQGLVKLVQIDADINPGNSGGPVVDEKGNLVGVAVSKTQKGRIGFAVPIQPLEEILQGKVGSVAFDTLKVKDDQADVAIEANLLDPLAKLKNVAVHYRPADAGALLQADKEGRMPLLKDAKKVALKLDPGKGLGAFTLEGGGKDKVAIAFQASYVNSAGKTIVTPAGVATIDFTQVIHADKLTRDDPIDKARGQPHKKFTHEMEAGKHYVIEMRGDPKQIDPWLIVRDSTGKTLAEDDDSGGLLNSLIVLTAPKDDEYQIIATVFKGGPMGPFTLRIREETGRQLGPRGWNMTGALSPGDPRDRFMQSAAQSFNLLLKKGKTYVADMKSKEFDPFLRLENMAGVHLKNEDVGGGGHSTLVFAPLQDGIYRLVATTYDFKTGPFDLKVAEGPPRMLYEVGPAGLKLAGILANTDGFDVVNGQPSKARRKIFEVKMKAGQKHQIDLTSTQFDAFLRVENAAGQQLAADDDSGGMLNSRLIFSPQADGIYRIVVTHFDGKFGAFNLMVRLAP